MGEITTTTDNGVNVAVTLVTPELAKEWLEWNIGNRRQRRSCINSYAKDMTSGNWSLTNDAITFDEKGFLTNGQNRLCAVVKSNTSQYFLVAKGIPHNKNMDRPSIRSISDNLRMFTDIPEFLSKPEVVGMCNYILRMLNREEGSITVRYEFMKQYEKELTAFMDEVGVGGKVAGAKAHNAPILAAFFVAHLNGVDATILKNIRKTLQTGEYAFRGYASERFLPALKLERSLRDCSFKNNDERYSWFLRTIFCIHSIAENRYLKQSCREAREIYYDINFDGRSLRRHHEQRVG